MRRKEYLGVCLAFIAITCLPYIAYGDLYREGLLFGSGDMLQGYASLLFSAQALWSGGGIPLWAPWLANGVPYLADVSMPTLYPPMLAIGGLPTLDFVYVFYGLHLAIGTCFFYLYLREIGCSKAVSACTACMYLFSVQLGGMRKEHITIIATIVWLPVQLFFVERYLRTRRRLFFVCIPAVMALQFLGGFVQDELYTDIVVAIYFCVVARHSGMRMRDIFRHMGVIVGLYLGLAMVQLLPAVELLHTYTAMGAQHVSGDYMLGYSIAPYKLIMMLFPQFFDDIFFYGGGGASSGYDIEIFFGTLVFCVFLLSFRYLRDFYVRTALGGMILSFAFAAHAHISFLTKILSWIPIINNMRVFSRILFVFILFGYILFAVTFERMRWEYDWKPLGKIIGGVFLLSCGFVLFFGIEAFRASTSISQGIYARAGIGPVVLLGALIFIKAAKKYTHRWTLLLLGILVCTVGETLPFWMMYHPYPLKSYDYDLQAELERQDGTFEGSYKAWDALSGFAAHNSPITSNTPLLKQVMGLNTYMAFNNPRLYALYTHGAIAPINASGLLIGHENAEEILHRNQGLLSMLGARYIYDSSNLLSTDAGFYRMVRDDDAVFSIPQIHFTAKAPYNVVYFPFPKIAPDTTYQVTLSCNATAQPRIFYVDLYDAKATKPDASLAGAHWDVKVERGGGQLSGFLTCGAVSSMEMPILRIVSDSATDFDITDLSVYRCHKETIDTYEYLGDDETFGYGVYRNNRAQKIFYVPQSVKSIASFAPLYHNPQSYDVDKVSWIEGDAPEFVPGKAAISNITIENNRMSAEIDAEAETFVNLSQNQYPGWHAYIDGVETEIFLVNGLIQGVRAPAGHHHVEFVFSPLSVKVGAAVSLATLVLVVVLACGGFRRWCPGE